MKRSHRYLFVVVVFALLVFPACMWSSVNAQTDVQAGEADDGFSEDLSGFGEDNGDSGFPDASDIDIEAIREDITAADTDSRFVVGGFIKEEIGYSFEHNSDLPEFSKIRSILNISSDLRISRHWRARGVLNGFYDYAYANYGRDKFTDETLDTYETEAEIRDLFVDGALWRWLRLKFGRQIIAWGQSDYEQITDLANPRDNRELGMVDLEDARIPVLATKISMITGSWELNLVAIHENRPNKTPSAGSEFDPLGSLRGQVNINDEEIPENKIDNTEYLVRLFKTFNGGDVSLVWADVYEDGYYLDFDSYNVLAPTRKLTVTPKHKRIQSIGIAGNLVSGSWLFKSELARKSGAAVARSQENLEAQMTTLAILAGTTGTTYYNKASEAVKTWSEKDLIQGMLGFEYSGLDDLTISVEGTAELIAEYEDNLKSDELSGSITSHLGYSALNDTFNADLYWFHLTGENGDVYRFNMGYDLQDALNMALGVIFYEAEETDALVYPFRNNDRVYTSIKYSF